MDSSGAHDGGNLHQRRTIGRLAFFREETTIDARSWPDHPTIVADCHVRISICGSSTIKARSPQNQSPIATRSWPDRCVIMPTIRANSPKIGLIFRGIEATMPPKVIAPTTPAIHSHDRINRPPFLGQISL